MKGANFFVWEQGHQRVEPFERQWQTLSHPGVVWLTAATLFSPKYLRHSPSLDILQKKGCLFGLALHGYCFLRFADFFRITQVVMLNRFETLVKLIDQWNTRWDIQFHDLLV